MKKIKIGLISHFFDNYNLGCAALAVSNLKILDQVVKKCNIEVKYVIYITKGYNEFDISQYTTNSFEYRYYPRFRETLVKPYKLFKNTQINDIDLFINLCGGDGYTDIYGIPRLFAESQFSFLTYLNKKTMIFAPQTIGPFKHKISKKIAKSILNKVDYIFVRDSQSLECCESLNQQKKTIQVIDVAFKLPFSNDQHYGSNRIGVNVSGLLYNGGYNRDNYFGLKFNYTEFIHALVQMLLSKGYEIHLIPHVISDDIEIDDDYRACLAVKKLFPSVILPQRFKNPVDVKNYIAKMDLFSGARMHSTIAAFSSEVPVIPIAYSRKVNGLYNSLNYPYYIDAKADITKETALQLFMNYLDSIDEMKEVINNSRIIYDTLLEKYEKQLEIIIMEKVE